MVNFSEDELDAIISTANARGADGNPFSFYEFGDILEARGIEGSAKTVGHRIRQSVDDENDTRLPFRLERTYDDGDVKKDNNGSISYVLK